MIKRISKFRGLKDYYMSWGMQPVRGGRALAVLGRTTHGEIEGTLTNFQTPVAYGYERTGLYAYMLCDNGYLFRSQNGTTDWAEATNFVVDASYKNNMIVDQLDSVLIFDDDYVGKLVGAKDWTSDWTADHYTFSVGATGVFHPAALVQQYVLIGDSNVVARIDTTSGTYEVGDFTAAALTLPAGFVITAIAQAGGQYRKAIIATNRNKKGIIVEWDCVSSEPTSIVPVSEEVHALVTAENNRTYAIIGNGVLYDVSAYPIIPVFTPPDNEAQLTISDFRTFYANALATAKRKIYMGYSTGSLYSRHKAGVWIYDIDTGQTYPLCPISSASATAISPDQRVATIRAILPTEIGTVYRILVGSQDATAKGRHDYINDNPLLNGAFYISPIISDVKSRLRGIKFNLEPLLAGGIITDFVVSVLASYYTFDRVLWGYARQDGAMSVKNKVQIDKGNADSDTDTLPEVGDEITILEKTNAGYIRRVTAVDVSGDPYVITLDSDMLGNTETEIYMNVQPFKKLETTARALTEGGEVWIECKDKPEFRNLLIKLEFRITTGAPVMSDLDIYYDRLPQPR